MLERDEAKMLVEGSGWRVYGVDNHGEYGNVLTGVKGSPDRVSK